MTQDEKWMEMACLEAEKAAGLTSPNPIVGAVAVKNGKLISSGFHKKAGTAHAEVNCLQDGIDYKDATLYVTLEPCSSHGRTPPCTEKVIKSGVNKVIIGNLDPNPEHAGRAVKILEEAGISVESGILKERCWKLNLPFYKWIQTKKPLITLKMAMTLDGKIATKNGQSQWITGEEARNEVQRLRKVSDAIMVGGETVRLDNPSLKVKDETFRAQPQRFIWSSQKDWDKSLKCFENDGKCAETVKPESPEEWLAFIEELGKRDISSLLIEGGGELAANVLSSGHVDVVKFFIAPKILLGRDSRPVIGGTSPQSLNEALDLQNVSTSQFGKDILVEGYLSNIWECPC